MRYSINGEDMKRNLNLFLVLVLLFIGVKGVGAVSNNDAVKSINSASVSTNDLMTKLNTWISNNKKAVIYLTNEDIANNINSNNYEKSINYVISKLKSGGYTASANSLTSIKSAIVSDLNNIKNNQDVVYNYLEENKEYGVEGNLDVFHRMKVYVNEIDNKTGILLTTLYNTYYDDIKSNINNYSTVDDVIADVNKMTKVCISLINSFNNRIVEWQDMYNSYITGNYENKITSSSVYSKYVNKFDNGYSKLYDLIYPKFKNKLESKVNDIDNEKGIEVVDHNSKLYDIIDDLNKLKTKLNANYNDLSKYFKISLIKNKLNEKHNKTLNQIDKEIEYVKSHLWNEVTLIDVKNSSDNKYFDIDMASKIIFYKGDIISSNKFIEKLKTDYTKFMIDKLYSNNVGTDSKLKIYSGNNIIAEFLVSVIADVYPDGKITALDYVAIRKHIMGTESITSKTSKLAADCNSDNKISALDYIHIKNYIMNKGV